jgi:hypothetical protein
MLGFHGNMSPWPRKKLSSQQQVRPWVLLRYAMQKVTLSTRRKRDAADSFSMTYLYELVSWPLLA